MAASLQRADMGGSLNTRELLGIAGVLRAARAAGEYGAGEERTPISHLFHALTPNRFLEDTITNSIVGEDELADSASPELASIRRHMRATEAKVRDILQKLISSNQSKYLQEAIITIRSDRYVVPVKSEHKNAIPGLVHDVSSSGSTFFIEPMGVVKANNERRELAAKEKKEIERILAELSAQCAAHKEDILEDYQLLVWLDAIFARAKLSVKLECTQPRLSDKYLRLRGARHPLLDQKKAVANDLELGDAFDTLVITGPNTGGKTVTLKTMGLLTLMAQCGLHIPARDDSTVRVFSRVLADIGDEQSIAQSLSTFSSHMTNIVGILGEADDSTLILFDELGAGTDPVEGAALAAAIIESARGLGSLVAATTHYAELKTFAMTTAGVENASCEFDVETLRPTYRLLIGIPGKSNAFAISQRLGLSKDVIADAKRQMNGESVRFEDVITQLESKRQALEKKEQELDRLAVRREEDARKAREFREQMEKAKENARSRGEAEARRILKDARQQTDAIFAELEEMRRRQAAALTAIDDNGEKADLRRRLNEAEAAVGVRQESREPIPKPSRPIRVGDQVEIPGVRQWAEVTAVNKDGSLSLKAGILKMTVKPDEVRLVEEAERQGQKKKAPPARSGGSTVFRSAASSELDIRGMESIEADSAVQTFLSAAAMGHLETVTIIHGKGTGALRKAVHETLKRSKLVKSFRLGVYGEGESGVTVVTLK